MKDWKEFNDLKDLGWKTKTQEEYTKWQNQIKEWYKNQQHLTDWEKDQIKAQLEEMNKKKIAYFEKKKQYTPTTKVTYLLQPELAEALTAYIQLKTAVLASEYEGRLNIEKEKNFC